MPDENNNTGNWNTGNRNTGDLNTGNWNTGNRNTGDLNTGDLNTGNWNTGDLNTGNWNTGYFCENDGPVMFFDQRCELTREQAIDAIPYIELPVGAIWIPRDKMTAEEISANPNCDKIGGYLKARTLPIVEAFPLAWATLGLDTKRRFTALPNFDHEKFLRITGVDVRLDRELNPVSERVIKTAVIDGVEYQLVPVEK